MRKSVPLSKNIITMNDFLHKLQLTEPFRPDGKRTVTDTLRVLLTFGGEEAFVRVIDKKKNTIFPDYRDFHGDDSFLLKRMEMIRRKKAWQITWGEPDEGLSLRENPDLAPLLMQCSHLVDANGKQIKRHTEEACLSIRLQHKGKRFLPQLEAMAGKKLLGKVRMVAENCILANGRVLCMVPPVGEDYWQLPLFLEPFAEELLSEYLALFYTYIYNVSVSYDDEPVMLLEKPVHSEPELLFERMGCDRALFVRLAQYVNGYTPEFLQQYRPMFVAMRGAGERIVVRPLEWTSTKSLETRLLNELDKHISGRQNWREFYHEGDLFIIPQAAVEQFLLESVPLLMADVRMEGCEKLLYYRVVMLKPRITLNMKWGFEFLEGEVIAQIGDEEFTLQELIERHRKYHFIELADGKRALMDHKYMEKLERIFTGDPDDPRRMRFSFFDLPEVRELTEGFNDDFKLQLRQFYEGFNELSGQTLELPAMHATLRRYQVEGVKWLEYLYKRGIGGCLADDMGLGKTIQTIAMLTLIYPDTREPSLIVMPPSLLFNWKRELERFAPQLRVYVHYGKNRSAKQIQESHITLSTYAIVRNDMASIGKINYHYIILDESQIVKNLNALMTQAIHLLHGRHRLALSGTPVENGLRELYALFRFLNPQMFGSAKDFNLRYLQPVQQDNGDDALRMLRKKIYPFILRRLKRDVLPELPDRIEQTIFVEMDERQAALYDERRRHHQHEVRMSMLGNGGEATSILVFKAMNELRQLASVPADEESGTVASTKLDLLAGKLEEATANGHKSVVFFNFLAGIEEIGRRLTEMNIGYEHMTGSTHDRERVIKKFQEDDTCRVLLMTLKTGGVGLNLTVADTVFLFEPWWNRSAEEQAIDRLHRYGQTEKVLSYRLITAGSIEERILHLQEKKAKLLGELISEDTLISKYLSNEDIEYILS